jgi:cytochrome P450
VVALSYSLTDEATALFDCRPDLIADRYSLYRRMRQEAPALRIGSQVLLSRYVDVQPAHLADEVLHSGGKTNMESSELRQRYEQLDPDRQAKMVAVTGFRGKWVNAANGQDHSRLRMLAHKSFTPRVLANMHERIKEITNELLDQALATGEVVDLISQFAWQLPLMVISEMLDVPEYSREDIRRWSVDLATFSGGADYAAGLDAAYPSMFALKAHLTKLFQSHRGGPTRDLMGALLAAQTEQGDRFTEDELIGMFAVLVFAGHETTTNLIGNGIYALLAHPEQWDLLRSDVSLVPNAVDEVLRYLSPVQLTKRLAAEDTEIAGVEIPKDQTVTFLLGSANRDPGQFADPDAFDIRRAGNKHLAFGLGPHFCLGAALARMEGAAALHTFATRFPDLEVVTDQLSWQPNTTFCALSALPVRLGRDRGPA